MAAPFYSQADQDIYESGNKFIPQEQYRLGYTAPPSIANASTGITNTQVAAPYKWPPQGYYPGAGDGGGGGGLGKYNLNPETQKDFRAGVWSTDMSQNPPGMDPMTASYKPENRKIAQDQSGNWKFVDTGKNVYHANINAKPMFASLLEKATGLDLKGKYGLSDEFTARKLGSTTGEEWEEEFDPTVAGKNLNVIQRWKAKKEFKAAQAQQAAADQMRQEREASASQAAAQGRYDASVASGREGGGWYGGADYSGGKSGDVAQAGPGRDPSDRMAQGGRIGYNRGRVVNPGGYAGEKSEIIEWDPNLLDLEISGIKGSEIMDSWKQQIKKLRYELLQAEKPEFEGMWTDEGLAFNRSQLEDLENKFKGGIFDKNPENAFPPEKGSKLNPLNWFAEGGRAGYFDGGIARLL